MFVTLTVNIEGGGFTEHSMFITRLQIQDFLKPVPEGHSLSKPGHSKHKALAKSKSKLFESMKAMMGPPEADSQED